MKQHKTLRALAEAMLRTSRQDVAGMSTEDIQALVHELQVHQMELELQNEELRQSQHELAESRDRYAELYDFAPVGYVTLDEEGGILEANLTTADMLGVGRQDLVGAKLSRFVGRDSQDLYHIHRQAVFSSEAKQSCELNMHQSDGTRLVLRIESVRFLVPNTDARRCRSVLSNVTERKRAELKVVESERRYRRLTQAVTDYIFTVRVENSRATETVHGTNCLSVTGYTAEEFMTNPMLWISMVPEEDREAVKQQVSRILSRQEAPPIEHRICRKDGRVCWVLNVSVAQYDDQGLLIAYDGLIRDITARKEAEGEFRQLNETLEQRVTDQTREVRLLAEAMAKLGEGVMISSDHLIWPGPEIIYVNEAMCRITGYATEELIGQTPRILQGEMTDQNTINRLRHELSKKNAYLCELVSYRKDGTPYDAELFITPLYNSQGEHTNFIAIHRDITERKRIERELQENEERLRAILNTAADGIITIDKRGTVINANPATEAMFGYTSHELIGHNGAS